MISLDYVKKLFDSFSFHDRLYSLALCEDKIKRDFRNGTISFDDKNDLIYLAVNLYRIYRYIDSLYVSAKISIDFDTINLDSIEAFPYI